MTTPTDDWVRDVIGRAGSQSEVKKSESVTVGVSEDTYDALNAAARQQRRTLSAFIRLIILDWQNPPKQWGSKIAELKKLRDPGEEMKRRGWTLV